MRPYAVTINWSRLPDTLLLFAVMGFGTLAGVCLFLDITPWEMLAAILEEVQCLIS